MRGIIRKSIRTRSGVSEIRVERRAIVAHVLPNVASLDLAAIERKGKSPANVSCDIPECLSIADDISRQLRNRIAFPHEFWKGAVE